MRRDECLLNVAFKAVVMSAGVFAVKRSSVMRSF
jgi:hypothetical protein